MAKCENRVQRKARKDYLCNFCFGVIKAGTEYVSLTGIDDCNAGWYNLKRHIHCDALANRCMELTHDEKCKPSEVYDDLRDVCPRTGCANLHDCPLLCRDSHNSYKRLLDDAYKRMFTCETVVSAYLPEGPIRNAALHSIRENKGKYNVE